MSEPRNVEMVRVPREEEYYDREAVLGRDATSVFPQESLQQQAASKEAMVEALGARKFISESELATIKATRGGTVDDGSVAADKPLAAILAERKAEKDAAFQEQWKQMKTGKNRPLDPEEADFFAGLRRLQAEQELKAHQEESSELEAFREAVKAAAAPKGESAGTAAEPGEKQGEEAAQKQRQQQQQPVVKKQPLVKPIIKVIPKGKRAAGSSGSGGGGGGVGTGAAAAGGGSGGEQSSRAANGEGPECKRPKLQKGEGEDQGIGDEQSGDGLAGLLGGYGSGSEEDDS